MTDAGDRRAIVEAVAARLGDRLDAIVDEIADRVLREVAEYRDRSIAERGGFDLRTTVRQLAGMFIEAIAESRRLSLEERGEVARLARRRAGQGLSLEAMTQAVDTAVVVAHGHLVTAWEKAAEGRAGRESAMAAMVTSLRQCEADVLGAFEAGYGSSGGRRRHEREDFLRRLLQEGYANHDAARKEARSLGIDVSCPMAVVLVTAASGHEGPDVFDQRTPALVERLTFAALGPVHVDHHLDEPPFAVLMFAGCSGDLRRDLDLELTASCPELGLVAVHATADHVGPELGGIRSAFDRLRSVVPVLPSWVLHRPERRNVAMPEQLTMHVAASGLPVALQEVELRATFLPLEGALQPKNWGPATVRGVVENKTLEDAAKQVYVTSSTLQYRVRRIEQITGLDLTADRGRWQLALALYELNPTVGLIE